MTGKKGLPTDDDAHPPHGRAKGGDEDAYDPKKPGESKAGRGGIVSPGGTQPKPTEDPRNDAGIAQPKK